MYKHFYLRINQKLSKLMHYLIFCLILNLKKKFSYLRIIIHLKNLKNIYHKNIKKLIKLLELLIINKDSIYKSYSQVLHLHNPYIQQYNFKINFDFMLKKKTFLSINLIYYHISLIKVILFNILRLFIILIILLYIKLLILLLNYLFFILI